MSRHGADPRSFTLLAAGGAGPMTACLLAREMGLSRVVVPPTPGVLSAYGGLIADIRNDFIRTAFVDLDAAGLAALDGHAADLETRALHWLRQEQGFQGEARLIWSADMRHLGQSYEIETVVDRADIVAGNPAPFAEAFHIEHARVYDHSDPKAPIQVVNLRLVVSGSAAKPKIAQRALSPGVAKPARQVEVYLDGAIQSAGLFERARLEPGQTLTGPAIISQEDCTTIVPPGFAVEVDAWGNLVIEPED
jgi:N-methylhydantoinase A